MDDGLVLNIAVDDAPSKLRLSGKKGGRWTERLKTNRTLKRKTRTNEPVPSALSVASRPSTKVNHRPRKKARLDVAEEASTTSQSQPRQPPNPKPAQVISSLFTYNPQIELPPKTLPERRPTAPSNAPLDSSTFSGLGLHPLLIAHLTNKMDIQKPTAIQRASLPTLFSTDSTKSSRDVFLQSQTGSGKTLSYLLPIIQDLLPLSELSYIDRSIGTLAVIIAPTRELAKQISDVVESMLQMRLRTESESTTGPDTSARLTRWLVSGLLVGGSTRTHEKARLRKGIPILVSTPGRLLDHLQNTSSFNVGKCRWLILDEADQLMELGFEDTVKGIIQGLDGRRRLAKQAMEEGKTAEVGGWDWERRRRAVLCSATIREDVQKLAGTALIEPLMIKATEVDKDNDKVLGSNAESFTPPSQLTQKYVIAPLKLRLVSLVALLRTLVAQTQVRHGAKIIVFLSCTDSVDFHWNLLGGTTMDEEESRDSSGEEDHSEGEEIDDRVSRKEVSPDEVQTSCPLLPGVTIYRLHGSLPTASRLASIKGFAGKNKNEQQSTSSILLCTSVASRGLDLPLVRAVIQYDLPTEGGATEYVHRVGRTARAGKGGEAWNFVAPSESDWVNWIQEKIQGEGKDAGKVVLSPVAVEELLRSGFGGKGNEYEARATEVQLTFEQWVLRKKENASFARKAFLSHMRAYTTHPSNEKHIFHIRNLHMGHLAKAFGLRDAPNTIKGAGQQRPSKLKSQKTKSGRSKHRQEDSDDEPWAKNNNGDAEKRMQAVVRERGRLTKKGGVMTSTGASEFQISTTADLEKLLSR